MTRQAEPAQSVQSQSADWQEIQRETYQAIYEIVLRCSVSNFSRLGALLIILANCTPWPFYVAFYFQQTGREVPGSSPPPPPPTPPMHSPSVARLGHRTSLQTPRSESGHTLDVSQGFSTLIVPRTCLGQANCVASACHD